MINKKDISSSKFVLKTYKQNLLLNRDVEILGRIQFLIQRSNNLYNLQSCLNKFKLLLKELSQHV